MKFDICRSKTDDVNVTQNTGTAKRLMTTVASSLHLFTTSYVTPAPEDQSTIQTPGHTPDIYLGDSWFTSIDVVEHVNGYYI